MSNERKDQQHSDHVIPGVPGGNAELDPAKQSHRRDMEDDSRNGEAGSYRGNLPANTPASSEAARPAAVRGQDDEARTSAAADDESAGRNSARST